MTSKGKQRTPPDLMSELLGTLQENVPLPSQAASEPAGSSTATEQLTDISTGRLVDLSARPQVVRAETRKRDGTELARKTHYLTPDHVRLLKEFAFMTGQGESDVVRQALEEFFARHGHEAWGAKSA